MLIHRLFHKGNFMTWKIEDLKYSDDADKGIVVAAYRFIASNDGVEASAFGKVNFSYDSTDPDFVPFDNVSEEMVIGWVKQHLGDSGVIEVQDRALSKWHEKHSSNLKSGLPWVGSE